MSKTKEQAEEIQTSWVLGVYAIADRYPSDAVEMLIEQTHIKTVEMLYDILTCYNPNQSKENRELNQLFAPIVKARLETLRREQGLV